MDKRKSEAFTLIELLVSMSILVVIILIVGMFFQRASVAWDTGTRKAESLLTGRALADFMSQEMAMALPITNSLKISGEGDSMEFIVLADASGALRATQRVEYVFSNTIGTITRNEEAMCEGVFKLEFDEETVAGDLNPLPLWVNIKVGITNEMMTNWFHSRAAFPNRGRDG